MHAETTEEVRGQQLHSSSWQETQCAAMADTHGHGTRHTAGQRPMNTQLYTNSGVLTDSADSWDRTVQTPGTVYRRLGDGTERLLLQVPSGTHQVMGKGTVTKWLWAVGNLHCWKLTLFETYTVWDLHQLATFNCNWLPVNVDTVRWHLFSCCFS